MATLLKVDGSEVPYPPSNSRTFALSELQAAVDGYIEGVYFADGRIMYVNEEGRVNNLPVNQLATRICSADPQANEYLWGGDAPIVGPALLLTVEEVTAQNEEEEDDDDAVYDDDYEPTDPDDVDFEDEDGLED